MREKERFNLYVYKTHSCWFWIGVLNPAGYGQMTWEHQGSNNKMMAHRASWLIHRGEIPKGMDVCHSCDIRQCVNPEHLFLGSRKQNMRDANIKGTLHGGILEKSGICIYGHPFKYRSTTGKPYCPTCNREYSKWYFRKKLKIPPSRFRTF